MSDGKTNSENRFFEKAKGMLTEPFKRVLDSLFLVYAIVVLIAGIGDGPEDRIDYRPFVVVTIFYSLVKLVVSGMKMTEAEQVQFLVKWEYFVGICTFAALVVWYGKWMGWWL